jgi:RNA recognition motif-containing protein
MKIFVGNLSFNTTENDLTDLFTPFGAVESASIITDRDTGRSKGFGFVAMSDEDAAKAISALSGKELDGRNLTINEARPMVKREFSDRSRGGGGGGGRGRYSAIRFFKRKARRQYRRAFRAVILNADEGRGLSVDHTARVRGNFLASRVRNRRPAGAG